MWVGFFAKISYPRDLRLVLSAFSKRRRFLSPDETWSIVEPIGNSETADREARR